MVCGRVGTRRQDADASAWWSAPSRLGGGNPDASTDENGWRDELDGCIWVGVQNRSPKTHDMHQGFCGADALPHQSRRRVWDGMRPKYPDMASVGRRERRYYLKRTSEVSTRPPTTGA